jgi:predicted Zn-dependent peptidase
MKKLRIYFLIVLLISGFIYSSDFNFDSIKKNISEFTLKNGLKFILLEDHSVPIATFITYANVGASDERIGIYGISHFLEHMAFKGSEEIGTTDIKAERKMFKKMDALFAKIRNEQNKIRPDKKKLKEMNLGLTKLGEQAGKYVKSNEFGQILTRNGCKGMNAGTASDSTQYFFSLPSNKLELWAYMESSRFINPVFREFYRERKVIAEERRVRTENSPIGKMIEEISALAFKDHSYHVSVIGPMSNILNITRADMKKYFRKNYTAQNIVIGVAGDVYPDELKKMAKKYFSKMRSGVKNIKIFTREPAQIGEKRMTIYEDSQPWFAMGFHIPSILDKDFIKFSVLDNIITRGRSSRLYKKMVIDKKSALAVISMAGFPGNKYSSLYLVLALPNTKHTTAEMERELIGELEKLKKEGVTEEELKSAKARIRIDTINQMNSRQGLLSSLLSSEVLQGSWRKTFDELQEIEEVTVDNLKELANKYFVKTNRTIITIEKKQEDKK